MRVGRLRLPVARRGIVVVIRLRVVNVVVTVAADAQCINAGSFVAEAVVPQMMALKIE